MTVRLVDSACHAKLDSILLNQGVAPHQIWGDSDLHRDNIFLDKSNIVFDEKRGNLEAMAFLKVNPGRCHSVLMPKQKVMQPTVPGVVSR
jgi:hypothetical protein